MRFGLMAQAEALLAKVCGDLERAVEQHQKNVVAPELDVSPTHLRNLLAGVKKMSALQLIALMVGFDDGDYSLKRLAASKGYGLKRLQSPEEQLERLREVMRRRVGNVADEIEREALGEDG